MIHLRTLGGLDLRGGDPREMRAVMTRPKRFALLVYLALAGAGGYHRRDSLLAIFWPESNTDHARNALRQSLYALRKSLGSDVFDARGIHEIGINWSVFSCDAKIFESALDAGRSVDALETYHGDLLPGFFVSEPAFEQWLDSERSRLRRRAEREARILSDRFAQSGDLSLAVQWARHAAAFSPGEEGAVRRLIDLLAKAGDRTEIVRVYESFRKRLADDYQMEPSVELEVLASEIIARRGMQSSSPWSLSPASRPLELSRSEAERHNYQRATGSPTIRLAVLPFSILAVPRFAYLREAAAEMLRSILDGAGSLRMVDPNAIRSFCGTRGDAEIQQGKSLAHRFGADQFILGTVIGAGRKIGLRASLHEADGSVTTIVEAGPAIEDRVFELVDEIGRKLLSAEYAGPAGRIGRSAAEATASISALRHFLEAERNVVSGRWVKAREAYEQAVAEDPTFALGWDRMSWNSCWLLQPAEARAFSDKALGSIARFSERDAIRFHAFRAYLVGDADEAERQYRAVLSRWPDDVQAYIGLGVLLITLNPMRARSPDEAAGPLSYARILDPENVDARLMLAYLAARRERYDELDSLREWLPPDSDYQLMIASNHSVARRNLDEMLAIRSVLEEAPDLLVHECARFAAVVGHDITESHRIAALLTRATRTPEVRAVGHVLMAQAHLVRGCIQASKPEFLAARSFAPVLSGAYRALAAVFPFVVSPQRELEELRRELAGWNLDVQRTTGSEHLSFLVHTCVYPQLRQYLLAVLTLRLGKKRTALDHAAKLLALPGESEATALAFDLSLSIRAQVAQSEGNAAEALSLLEETRLRPRYERVQMQSPFFSENLERYTRARLLEDCGRLDEALSWYDTMCENGVHEFVYLAPSHFRRGVIHQRLGNREEAWAHLSKVTELWAGADGELRPMVNDATRRLARIAGSS
ncbi:MAG: BTAD domain-containing putative transcriptional regulator [Gemmatimonadaceae bacterium]